MDEWEKEDEESEESGSTLPDMGDEGDDELEGGVGADEKLSGFEDEEE